MWKSATIAPLLLLASCAAAPGAGDRSDAAAGPEAAAATTPEAVAAGNRRFALALHDALAEDPDANIFFSPLGIGTAFGPVTAGARGATRDEIGQVMGYPSTGAGLPPAFGALTRQLVREEEGMTVSIVNALWPKRGFAMASDFVDTAGRDYEAAVEQLDFAGDAAGSADRINGWADEATRGRVSEVVSPDMFDGMTRLVVTNAVYFLGDWAAPFAATDTADAPFTLADGSDLTAPMMNRTGEYRWVDAGTYEALDLPYRGEQLVMTVLLPKREGGLAALERRLDAPGLARTLDALDAAEPRRVELRIPKLELRTQYRLADTLAAMGMPTAFTDRADFSGITVEERLRISDVIHQTFLRVDEEGTEAAAVTAVTIVATGARIDPEPPHVFHADHPFLFLIRDRESGAILFMGRIARPES